MLEFPNLGPKAPPLGPDPYQEKPKRGTLHGRLLVFSMADLDTVPARSYLLKGVLSPNEISIWVGPPKCGKSFLLMYVAYKLALGQSVFGRRVKPARVLYVAAEGEGGIHKRLLALRREYGGAENFHWIAQPIDLLRDGGHTQEVINAAKAVKADLIVIDTLNRALAGGDENRSDDMGTLIGHVSDIKLQTSAHVALIHHGTKASNGSSPRGHGSLTAADDVLVEVQKLETSDRVATLVHSKDDADGARWGFKLDLVELTDDEGNPTTDEDGDPITTLIVRETNEPPEATAAKPKPSAKEAIGLEILQRCINDKPVMVTGDDSELRAAVTVETWRQAYLTEANQADNDKTRTQAFRRVIDKLQEKGLITTRGGFVWRPSN